jgi:hypothetical protein
VRGSGPFSDSTGEICVDQNHRCGAAEVHDWSQKIDDMVFKWKYLLEPPDDSAARKKNTCTSHTDTCHQAGKAKHHPEREGDRPSSVSRHLNSPNMVLS